MRGKVREGAHHAGGSAASASATHASSTAVSAEPDHCLDTVDTNADAAAGFSNAPRLRAAMPGVGCTLGLTAHSVSARTERWGGEQTVCGSVRWATSSDCEASPGARAVSPPQPSTLPAERRR